ncbi:MAG: bifunctional folylpolyglutamate synthase/dihydrofolate synthase [Bacteroidales bacterium]|nr:bifunctional folylpolyglutamate synthase/dihydrofolate synthase [Bacteroidales bacterium]MCM1147871.1 bifunctional folylpolyglutamate synthase/dihydrofolate synthase [Bacteroidales bacterium]MCM1206714.1 bifunctional folylpolyglutamate synthase/dihydrofolate synthase [Bacillota bacterium]MCM1510910.1 bifunctional folylpolyglutamate synthase/dihydrofolate synthase [Clostridium sp.]
MNYSETIDYLYNAAPAFTKVGAVAYKPGLFTTEALDKHAGHPHREYLTVHVAGTNGKGSCSHTLAAILQTAGMKVGLYTSPHLVTFRERIRANGEMISEEYITDWVARNKEFFEPLQPSFFELTTAMALEYFRDSKVDIAVIEVGLGGRLDCTNIIKPILSVITNISFDHTQFLGDTLAAIAGEKAGIIKPHVPVVIGETTAETRTVFLEKAEALNAPICFAEDNAIAFDGEFELKGYYQEKNRRTILNCLTPLFRQLKAHGIDIKNATETVKHAMSHVCEITGLQGRWQIISEKPLTVCDTGHNVAGWQYLSRQITETFLSLPAPESKTLRIIFGMVDDKDIDTVMALLPKDAEYYFTQAETHRAIPATDVMQRAGQHNLKGKAYTSVGEAHEAARMESSVHDMLFIGGSSYIVADLLTEISRKD